MPEKPRALIVTRNFPPLVGGMERLIWHVADELGKEYQVDVIGPAGCADSLNPPHRGFGCKIKPVPWFLTCAALKAFLRVILGRYRIIIAGSGVTAPIVVTLGKLFRIPSLVFVHGLDLIAESPIYQRLFVPFIAHANTVIANSHNTASLAAEKGVHRDRIEVIFPGVEIPETPPDPKPFIEKYGLTDRKILLSVGRIIPRKGLAEFVDRCMPDIIKAVPEAILVVIGDEPADALAAPTDYRKKLDAAVEHHSLQPHVLFAGRVDDDILHSAYAGSDLFVFPLREVKGDVEGFGIVAIEAAAYGLPPVAFRIGGVPDAVDPKCCGRLIAPDNYPGYTEAILQTLNSPPSMPETCIAFASNFQWTRFGSRLKTSLIKFLS